MCSSRIGADTGVILILDWNPGGLVLGLGPDNMKFHELACSFMSLNAVPICLSSLKEFRIVVLVSTLITQALNLKSAVLCGTKICYHSVTL